MELPEELVEEVLLRLPPAEPASLVRAALVSKAWYRIVSAPRFRRRFLHRGAPPVTGLLCNLRDRDGYDVSRLVPTSPICPHHEDHVSWCALDARHGRVLLDRKSWEHDDLVVWEPVTYGRSELPPVLAVDNNAAGGACDHIDCHGGPFVIVSLGVTKPVAGEDTGEAEGRKKGPTRLIKPNARIAGPEWVKG